MLTNKFVLIAVIVTFLIPKMSMFAQDAGALLDLLVKKKLITEQEAKQVRAELKKQAPAPPAEGPTKTQRTYDGKTYVEQEVPAEKTAADKWKLSTPLSELELYGDVRLRYAYNGGQTVTSLAMPGRFG